MLSCPMLCSVVVVVTFGQPRPPRVPLARSKCVLCQPGWVVMTAMRGQGSGRPSFVSLVIRQGREERIPSFEATLS